MENAKIFKPESSHQPQKDSTFLSIGGDNINNFSNNNNLSNSNINNNLSISHNNNLSNINSNNNNNTNIKPLFSDDHKNMEEINNSF